MATPKHGRITYRVSDSDGKEYGRETGEGFGRLPNRAVEALLQHPLVGNKSELRSVLEEGLERYDMADYRRAKELLEAVLREVPACAAQLFYYMRVCARVLATPLLASEIRLEESLGRAFKRPRILRWLLSMPHDQRRCKWCGRFTRHVPPNTGHNPAFMGNNCSACGREYPMPTWIWDSPDGRAYSFYRHSFVSEEFYTEFTDDFEVV